MGLIPIYCYRLALNNKDVNMILTIFMIIWVVGIIPAAMFCLWGEIPIAASLIWPFTLIIIFLAFLDSKNDYNEHEW